MARGVLAVLGSGEMAPGMTKVHRELLARHRPVRAVNFGFGVRLSRKRASDGAKLEEYFAVSSNHELNDPALGQLMTRHELERTIFQQRYARLTTVFAGPGSPSYALAQWAPLDLPQRPFEACLTAKRHVCISSAAA